MFINLDTFSGFLGSRDGSMGLWEVTEEVMSQAEGSQSEESVPSYAHISHRALKDIPKEYTNPYNCKVRALAFNNNHKVRFNFTVTPLLFGSTCIFLGVGGGWALLPSTSASVIYICLPVFIYLLQELGAVSLDGYFHLWKAEHNLCKVIQFIS